MWPSCFSSSSSGWASGRLVDMLGHAAEEEGGTRAAGQALSDKYERLRGESLGAFLRLSSDCPQVGEPVCLRPERMQPIKLSDLTHWGSLANRKSWRMGSLLLATQREKELWTHSGRVHGYLATWALYL